jgi:hypothetical protein
MATEAMSTGRRVLRVAAGAALALTCLRVWSGSASWEARAQAQIPDAGTQRAELVMEVRRTNQLLEEVLALLRTKTIKVEVQDEGGTSAKGTRPTPGPSPQKP